MSDNSFSARFRKLQNVMLRGGLSDGAAPQDIADMHGVDVNEIEKQLIMGERIEYAEHIKNNKDATKEEAMAIGRKIASDHLVEDPLYYTHLRKMERTVAKDKEQLQAPKETKPLPKLSPRKPASKPTAKAPVKPSEGGGMKKDIENKVMQKKDSILNRKQKVITNIEGKPKVGESVEESISSENEKNNREWVFQDKQFKDIDEATNNLIYLIADKSTIDDETKFEKFYKEIIDYLERMQVGDKVRFQDITVECKTSVSEDEDEANDDNNFQESSDKDLVTEKSTCIQCHKEMPGTHAFCSDKCFDAFEGQLVADMNRANEAVDPTISAVSTSNIEQQIQADTPLYTTLKTLLNFSDRWALFSEAEAGKMEIELKRGDKKLEFYLECSDNKDVPSITLRRKIIEDNEVCHEDTLEVPICDIFNLILSDEEIANYVAESKPFVEEAPSPEELNIDSNMEKPEGDEPVSDEEEAFDDTVQ